MEEEKCQNLFFHPSKEGLDPASVLLRYQLKELKYIVGLSPTI